jgi:HAD superfamily hydrolase (TIGR01509 family)
VTIRCVAFDLGGVLVDWNPRHLYKKLIPDETKREWFLTNVCTNEWHLQHDAGVPFARTTAAKIREFPEYEAFIRAWDSQWPGFFNGPVPGMPELLERLDARGVPLFCLTNSSGEKMSIARELFPFLSVFRDTVVSGDEKVMKPDRAIFDILVKRTGFAPAESLFVDDANKNTDAAQRLGFAVHHFKDAAGLEATLGRFGLA